MTFRGRSQTLDAAFSVLVVVLLSNATRADERFQTDADNAADNGADQDIKFPGTFLFAGSQLVSDGPGRREYLSDLSGNVISIVTFGDEVLCLPDVHGHASDSLMWQVDPTHLPRVGTNVTLRLRPKKDLRSGVKK